MEAAHSRKVAMYASRCEKEGMVFVPLAVDTLGGWHESALVVIDKLCRQHARAVGRDEGATVLHMQQRLGGVFLRDTVSLRGSCTPAEAPTQVSGLL